MFQFKKRDKYKALPNYSETTAKNYEDILKERMVKMLDKKAEYNKLNAKASDSNVIRTNVSTFSVFIVTTIFISSRYFT